MMQTLFDNSPTPEPEQPQTTLERYEAEHEHEQLRFLRVYTFGAKCILGTVLLMGLLMIMRVCGS